MPKPFKFRYVKQISGVFLLGIVMIVLLGVVAMARSQSWFLPMTNVTVDLPDEGSFGLRPGADVMVLGTVAGTVHSIRVGEERMFAHLRIRDDFIRFLRLDSNASIHRTLGIGDAYLEISRGKSLEPLGEGVHLRAEANLATMDLMEQTIEQIRVEVVPAIQELRAGVNEYTKVAEALRDPDGGLQATLANTRQITESISRGEGLAGKLVMDPQLASSIAESGPRLTRLLNDAEEMLADLRKTSASFPAIAQSADEQMKRMPEVITQMQQSMERTQAVLKHVEKSAAELPALVKSMNETSNALPGLVLQTQESFRQFQRFIEAAQQNWLISPFMDDSRDAGGGRIPTVDRGRSKGGR